MTDTNSQADTNSEENQTMIDRLAGVLSLDRRGLRRLEAVSLATTAFAFALTVLLVTTGKASEINPVALEILSAGGWAFAGVLGLAVEAAAFVYLDRKNGDERVPSWLVGIGAVMISLVGVADLALNLALLEHVGAPVGFYAERFAPSVGIVLVAAVVVFYRARLLEFGSSARAEFSKRVANGKAIPAGMVLLVAISVLSGVPFGDSTSPVQKVSAQNTPGVDTFEDGSSDGWGSSLVAVDNRSYNGDYSLYGGGGSGGYDTPQTSLEEYWAFVYLDGDGSVSFAWDSDDSGSQWAELNIWEDGSLYDHNSNQFGDKAPKNTWLKVIMSTDFGNNTYSLKVINTENGTVIGEKTDISAATSSDHIDRISIHPDVRNYGGKVWADDVSLTKTEATTDYTVSGTVKGPDGKALENVSVSDGSGNSTTTNATGYYSLSLANGTYDLTASHENYTDKTKTVTVDGGPETLDFSLCSAGGCPTSSGYSETFSLDDPSGRFLDHDPSLTVWEYAGTDLSAVDGSSGTAVTSDSWNEIDSGPFNWEGNRSVTLEDGSTYKYRASSGNGEIIEVSGYVADDSDGPTIIEVPNYPTPTPTATPAPSSGGGGGGGGSAYDGDGDHDDDGTPNSDDSDYTLTPTPDSGPEPTLEALGPCTVNGETGLRIYYHDPTRSTYEFDYSLEGSDGTLYEGSVVPDEDVAPLGSYYGCVLDSVTANASEDDNVTANWTARDDAGNVLESGSRDNELSAPIFAPSGNAPDSSLDRFLLILMLVIGLGALWIGGNRYAPGDEMEWWPERLEAVSPLFAIGAPILVLLVLDLSGGGVISAALSFGVARVAPLAGILGAGLAAYWIWVAIQPGDSF